MEQDIKPESPSNNRHGKIDRREILKGLATVPVLGALFYGWYRKQKYDNLLKNCHPGRSEIDG